MYKYVSLMLFCFAINNTQLSAQTKKQQAGIESHDYYVAVSKVNKHSDVEWLETALSNKSGVVFFRANQMPVRYFLLRTTVVVSRAEFATWLNGSAYQLQSFAEGLAGKELAMGAFKRLNTKQ